MQTSDAGGDDPYAEQIYPDAVFAVHLDHGDEKTCYDCIESGCYSSGMIDDSHEPFKQNVATTKRVVERAHPKGISVEAELGRLGGVEEHVKVDEGSAFLTNPDEAVQFVKETGCDSLACAIGTSHKAYKFKGKQSLHFEIIEAIKKQIPGTPIVMHGSSSVPEAEVRRINAAGGELDPSRWQHRLRNARIIGGSSVAGSGRNAEHSRFRAGSRGRIKRCKSPT